jgi:hypothetical protein
MTYDTYLCRFGTSTLSNAPSLLEDGIKVEWTGGHIGSFYINEPGCRTLVLELSCPDGTCDADVWMTIHVATPRDLTLPARRHLRSE